MFTVINNDLHKQKLLFILEHSIWGTVTIQCFKAIWISKLHFQIASWWCKKEC